MPSNFAPKAPGNPYANYDAEKLKAFLTGYQFMRDPGAFRRIAIAVIYGRDELPTTPSGLD
jgi:hypothetical protein